METTPHFSILLDVIFCLVHIYWMDIYTMKRQGSVALLSKFMELIFKEIPSSQAKL